MAYTSLYVQVTTDNSLIIFCLKLEILTTRVFVIIAGHYNMITFVVWLCCVKIIRTVFFYENSAVALNGFVLFFW